MILLDTHAFVWAFAEPRRLGKRAARMFGTAKRWAIADISLWEFAMLVDREKLKVDGSAAEWLRLALEDPRSNVLPISPEIALQAARLDATFHGDPADRLIVSTAIGLGAPLLTADRRIHHCEAVQAVWT
jgi:PIN domain nuclease of toxin-antitoxin system